MNFKLKLSTTITIFNILYKLKYNKNCYHRTNRLNIFRKTSKYNYKGKFNNKLNTFSINFPCNLQSVNLINVLVNCFQYNYKPGINYTNTYLHISSEFEL